MKQHLGLYDIQGLDTVSIWPLAPGWWILIGIIFLTILCISLRSLYLSRQRRSWRGRAFATLRRMERELRPENSKALAVEFAHLMRKLAMRRFSRSQCASLKGREWLTWLKSVDPKNYDWNEAQFLIEAPYCTDDRVFAVSPIQKALTAAKGWVK